MYTPLHPTPHYPLSLSIACRRGVVGSVRLENVTDCLLLLGPCCTSVYLESCTRCTLLAAAHQLRVHKSVGCRLFVRCQSHPIVEDCEDVGFAPYAASYVGIDQDFVAAGLAAARCWDNDSGLLSTISILTQHTTTQHNHAFSG